MAESWAATGQYRGTPVIISTYFSGDIVLNFSAVSWGLTVSIGVEESDLNRSGWIDHLHLQANTKRIRSRNVKIIQRHVISFIKGDCAKYRSRSALQ